MYFQILMIYAHYENVILDLFLFLENKLRLSSFTYLGCFEGNVCSSFGVSVSVMMILTLPLVLNEILICIGELAWFFYTYILGKYGIFMSSYACRISRYLTKYRIKNWFFSSHLTPRFNWQHSSRKKLFTIYHGGKVENSIFNCS